MIDFTKKTLTLVQFSTSFIISAFVNCFGAMCMILLVNFHNNDDDGHLLIEAHFYFSFIACVLFGITVLLDQSVSDSTQEI